MKKTLIASSAVALALMTAAPAFADSHITVGGLKIDGDTKVHVEHSDSDRDDDSSSTMGIGSEVRDLAHENARIEGGIGSLVRALAHDLKRSEREDKATTTVTVIGTASALSVNAFTLTANNGTVYTVIATNATVTGNDITTLAGVKAGDTVEVRGTLSGTTIVATRVKDRSSLRHTLTASLSGIAGGIVSAVSGNTFTIQANGTNATTTVVTNGSTTVRTLGDASSTVGVGSRVLVIGTSSTSTPNSITAQFIAIIGAGLEHLKHFLSL